MFRQYIFSLTRKTIVLSALVLCLSFASYAQSARIVCNETCREEYQKSESKSSKQVVKPAEKSVSKNKAIPSSSAVSSKEHVAAYSVVSPVGLSSVKMIQQAPRLSTLEGKIVAVVGVSFMTGITHPEIKRLINENYPTAKVILMDEIGFSGPYPAPGVTRKQNEEFKQRLKDMGVQAVISGNGGCGLCTPKETGSCITAEYLGIPSVMIAGPGFSDQARYTARNNGVPVMRVAQYPGAFAADTQETLIKNTREILWPQIVKALTTPITAEEVSKAEKVHADIRDDVFYGTLDEINDYFKKQNWTDGLPFIPPTYEKVMEYLKYTPYKYDEIVAVLPIAHRNTTAWHVAVNAVMAGCKPEYMPILIAMTKGLGDGNFRRTLASTHAWTPYCWLNGPVARQLGIDCGQGQINDEANASIGRFMNLALMNLCGYYVKQDRMGTFGYPMPWCLVEDETACQRVGWKPYHVRKGFEQNKSVVTLASTLLWGNNMAPSTTDPTKIMQLLAWDISERCQFALGSGRQYTFRTILLTEPVAQILAQKFSSPEALEHMLITESRRPLKERAFANYYANPGSRKDGGKHNIRQYSAYLGRTEGAEITKAPVWYDTQESEMQTVPTMKRGMTAFIITGDNARNKVQTMPGGGYASIEIELPSNWDIMMQNLGYSPLKNHYLR
ncbi:MAG: hypothetical protein KBS95_04945 [Alistipes sp.]|nr:hypothetical protein [Candidatus Alistipes equi]